MYEVIAQGPGGLRYGHKERAGIYLTDCAEDATAFQSRAEAQEFAEELTDLHGKSGLYFEVKEKALDELALIESKRVLKNVNL